MASAIDSSVLWAVYKEESGSHAWMTLLTEIGASEGLVMCEVAVAESAPLFDSLAEMRRDFQILGIRFDPILPETAFRAGEIFRRYRAMGGPRQRLVADFLIGAHALHQTDGLLTLDRGFQRSLFAGLNLRSP